MLVKILKLYEYFHSFRMIYGVGEFVLAAVRFLIECSLNAVWMALAKDCKFWEEIEHDFIEFLKMYKLFRFTCRISFVGSLAHSI